MFVRWNYESKIDLVVLFIVFCLIWNNNGVFIYVLIKSLFCVEKFVEFIIFILISYWMIFFFNINIFIIVFFYMNNYINYILYFFVKVIILYIILKNVYFMLKFNEIIKMFCKIIEFKMINSLCILSFFIFIFIYIKFFFLMEGRKFWYICILLC